ncbi:TetR/AcrR family transcriptional regulator [Hungatella sp. L12]|uniref:TetR/AcrR family transcriptional regulator n=2 Tax=Lachnospiraceae TaxID=186803 RepID=A0ABR7H521_9FIRM|nr:TetR/AcrR family transcriptional regulator [Hungatella hominis]
MAEKRATKEALLSTAIGLFQKFGFENITIDDICNEIDVTKTAFYYYYKSKDELIRDYFSTDNMLSSDELASILSAHDYANQVLRIIEIRIRHVTKAGVALTKELYRIYLKDEVIPLLPEQGGLSDIVTNLLERAQQEGQIKRIASPKTLCDSLCCLSNGILLKWIMTGGEFDVIDENRLLFEALFL